MRSSSVREGSTRLPHLRRTLRGQPARRAQTGIAVPDPKRAMESSHDQPRGGVGDQLALREDPGPAEHTVRTKGYARSEGCARPRQWTACHGHANNASLLRAGESRTDGRSEGSGDCARRETVAVSQRYPGTAPRGCFRRTTRPSSARAAEGTCRCTTRAQARSAAVGCPGLRSKHSHEPLPGAVARKP